MERLYLYNGALAVLGLSFLLNAVASFADGGSNVLILLFAVSGSGLIVGAGYESLRSDPTEFEISAGALFALIGGACVSLLGTLAEVLTTV